VGASDNYALCQPTGLFLRAALPFSLDGFFLNISYSIKITQDNLLVLVELHVMQQPDQNGPRDNGQMGNFLRMLGLDFPPNPE